MQAFLFTALAYFILPIATLYSCLASIYLLDFSDPEFWPYVALWAPGIFLYYIYIAQLIIGQRLPFLDRIWGFPNLIRKHKGTFRSLFMLGLLMHTLGSFRKYGLEKLVLNPDSGMIAAYTSVLGSIALMIIAAKVWLKPQQRPKHAQGQATVTRTAADYAKMHRLHQLFYLLAIGVWYHVVTAGAFQENPLGQILVSGYLLFALSCKLYMLLLNRKAPVYRLESSEVLHENFVRLRLKYTGHSKQEGKQVQALQQHKAGQYAYFSFAIKDQTGSYWEQHPFSFASLASQDSSDAAILTIVVKKLGDFTTKLRELPIGDNGTEVKVLGPYGKFGIGSPSETAAYADGVHLVAAGVGITPFLSILEQQAFETQLAQSKPAKPLMLHWFVHDKSELVFEDRFQYFREKLPNLQVQTYVGQSLSEGILQQVLSTIPSSPKLGVLYCGPGAVGPKVRKVMSRLGIPQRNFHTELFTM